MSTFSDSDRNGVTSKWKENLFLIHDSLECSREEDPPENAIVVFLAPVEVEVRTQVYLCGGLVAMGRFGISITGAAPRVFRTVTEKIALKCVNNYMLFLSGAMQEPDTLLAEQLDCLYRAFCFYHGSFDKVKESAGGDRKRVSSTLTRIWSSLISYFRPPRDTVHAAFRPIPFLGLLRNANRHYAMSSQLLDRISRRPGLLGGCVLHRQQALCTLLSPELTAYALALLQPTQSKSYTEEDNRRIQRRGLKIREMMTRGKHNLIKSREYRLRTYANCFLGHEMVDLLIEKGEVRTRDAARQLGRKLLQAGVIHQVMNEQDFRDDVKLYRFRVDEEDYPQQRQLTQPSTQAGRREMSSDRIGGLDSVHRDLQRSRSVDLRPLVLAGHGRDARAAAAQHGLSLPAGVHLLPVFLDYNQRLELWERLAGTEGTPSFPDGRLQPPPFDDLDITASMDALLLASETEAKLYQWMVKVGLTQYQIFLMEKGWISEEVAVSKLQAISPAAMSELAQSYSGDKESFSLALKKAHKLCVKEGKKKGSSDKKKRNKKQEALLPEGYRELGLYLQGLGGTAFVFLVSPEYKTQEFLEELSKEVGEGLSQLEHTLAHVHDANNGFEAQHIVEEYNHLQFDCESHAISGWCNTNRSVPDMRLLPDTDEDRAFVEAAAEMHSFFMNNQHSDVVELMLRKNYNTPIYAKSCFGLETYFQLRRPFTEPTVRDETRPFDEDLFKTPTYARKRLGQQGLCYL
eukprot:m.118915 g.118915  ORF g.118915 m.118915 type:complete len:743 (-) comp14296_c0_seq1:2237-4465(-)